MADIEAAVSDVVRRLRAAGIRAAVDARDLNPPAVLVRPPTLTYRFGKGYADAAFDAWVMVGSSGKSQELKQLSALLDQVQAALNHQGITARPDDAVLPDGSTAPMFVLSWTSRIPA